MEKTLTLISGVATTAVAALIILTIVMGLTSCSSTQHYSKAKAYHVTKKNHGCVGGTCRAF